MSFQKVPTSSTADPAGILPAPVTLEPGAGTTVVADGTTVVADPALLPAARWWRRVTEDAFGLDLVPAPAGAAPADGIPPVVFAVDDDLPPSGYRLVVGDDGVRVGA
ncbi:glycoside hydrolase family 20 zincin-like fold domain-containing protein, partial [Cellulosimicrobium cellulans]|uniref:glycoside hydrolase family 20 zincin-like fold domain-containing protein n=1 Tax=Cellulosimicrobium cellulans TaxID=1710 RepID=UPI002ADE080B